jgi:hypothetical protein
VPQDEAHAFVDLRCRLRCFRGRSDCVQHHRAFTSYTDLVLKAFYSGNPTPVPYYIKNVLTVPHVGYDILSVSFFEIFSTGRGKESDRN